MHILQYHVFSTEYYSDEIALSSRWQTPPQQNDMPLIAACKMIDYKLFL